MEFHMLFTVSSQGHKPENVTCPPTHTNTSFLLIAFLASEITDHPGAANCVHPKIPKPTWDACSLCIFSAWDFCGGEGKISDLGMFLAGQVYPVAAHLPGCIQLLEQRLWCSTWRGCRCIQPLVTWRLHGWERKMHQQRLQNEPGSGVHTPRVRRIQKLPRKDQALAKREAFLEGEHWNINSVALTHSRAAWPRVNWELQSWKHSPLKPFVMTGQLQWRCHYSQCLGLLQLLFMSYHSKIGLYFAFIEKWFWRLSQNFFFPVTRIYFGALVGLVLFVTCFFKARALKKSVISMRRWILTISINTNHERSEIINISSLLEARGDFITVGGADCPTVCLNTVFKVFLKILFPHNAEHPHYSNHQNDFHYECRAFSLDSWQQGK